MSLRPAISTSTASPTIEGAGVHLHRAFGFHDPKAHDPFLLFDDFRNDNPKPMLEGFRGTRIVALKQLLTFLTEP